MKKLIQALFIIYASAGCADDSVKELSIPVPVTHEPLTITSEGVILRGSIVEDNNKSLKTGFVITTGTQESVLFARIIDSDSTSNNEFFADLRDGLENQKVYYVRSFVEFNKKKIYGDQISFVSHGSEGFLLYTFEPEFGLEGDTILLRGRDFLKNTDQILVRFNGILAKRISASNSTIQVVLPNMADNNPEITVSNYLNTKKYSKRFTIPNSEILSITPASAKACDIITLHGKYFRRDPYQQEVKFGSAIATIIEGSDSTLQIMVPEFNNPAYSGIVISSPISYVNYSGYNLITSTITDSFYPESATFGDTLHFTGTNFNSCYAMVSGQGVNGVDDYYIITAVKSSTSIIGIITPQIAKEANIFLTVDGHKHTFTKKFKLLYGVADEVVPNTGKRSDLIEIHGQNFSTTLTQVMLLHSASGNYFYMNVHSISKNKIIAEIPDTYGLYGSMDLVIRTGSDEENYQNNTKQDFFSVHN